MILRVQWGGPGKHQNTMLGNSQVILYISLSCYGSSSRPILWPLLRIYDVDGRHPETLWCLSSQWQIHEVPWYLDDSRVCGKKTRWDTLEKGTPNNQTGVLQSWVGNRFWIQKQVVHCSGLFWGVSPPNMGSSWWLRANFADQTGTSLGPSFQVHRQNNKLMTNEYEWRGSKSLPKLDDVS